MKPLIHIKPFKLFEADQNLMNQPIPSWLNDNFFKGKYTSSSGKPLAIDETDKKTAWDTIQALGTISQTVMKQAKRPGSVSDTSGLKMTQDVSKIQSVKELQTFLINEMKKLRIEKLLVDEFGGAKTKSVGLKGLATTRQDLLDKLSIFLKDDTTAMSTGSSPANIASAQVKKAYGDGLKVSNPPTDKDLVAVFNHHSIFDLFKTGNNNKVALQMCEPQNVKNLFVTYWHRQICPPNWEAAFKKKKEEYQQKSQQDTDLGIYVSTVMKDLRTYGRAQAMTLSAYMTYLGIVPMKAPPITLTGKGVQIYDNLGEYRPESALYYFWEILPDAEGQPNAYTVGNFVDGSFGKMTLFALLAVYNYYKDELQIDQQRRKQLEEKQAELARKAEFRKQFPTLYQKSDPSKTGWLDKQGRTRYGPPPEQGKSAGNQTFKPVDMTEKL